MKHSFAMKVSALLAGLACTLAVARAAEAPKSPTIGAADAQAMIQTALTAKQALQPRLATGSLAASVAKPAISTKLAPSHRQPREGAIDKYAANDLRRGDAFLQHAESAMATNPSPAAVERAYRDARRAVTQYDKVAAALTAGDKR